MNALDRTHRTESQTWLDVISAVDYLSRGHRPGLTVYDAVEEALRWHIAALVAGPDDRRAFAQAGDLPWDDPDPLRSALERLVLHQPPAVGDEFTTTRAVHFALSLWTRRMADNFNDGCRWAHPQPPATTKPSG